MAETFNKRQAPHSMKFKSSSTKTPRTSNDAAAVCVQYN